jgi:hypothetical protein
MSDTSVSDRDGRVRFTLTLPASMMRDLNHLCAKRDRTKVDILRLGLDSLIREEMMREFLEAQRSATPAPPESAR